MICERVPGRKNSICRTAPTVIAAGVTIRSPVSLRSLAWPMTWRVASFPVMLNTAVIRFDSRFRVARMRATIPRSSSGFCGLATNSVHPAFRQRSRFCGVPVALMMMIGVAARAGFPRISAQAAAPSVFGISRSSRIRLGSRFCAMATASSPDVAVRTSNPPR